MKISSLFSTCFLLIPLLLGTKSEAQIVTSDIAPGTITDSKFADGAIEASDLNFEIPYICATNAPYNATGNGTTDDTAAIQSAINAASSAGGGIVYLPTGNYYIGGNLEVKSGVTLCGIRRQPCQTPKFGTTLLAYTIGSAPLILMDANSTLEGLCIYYPNQVQTSPPTPYAWTIRANGSNITIQDIMLPNSYNGIDLATYPSNGHLVRGVYGQPLNMGISVDQCSGGGRIENIHFSGTAAEAYTEANGIAISLGEASGEVLDDVFGINYHIGIQFISSSYGTMYGQLTNINFDGADIGLYVKATSGLGVHVAGLNVASRGGGTTNEAVYAPSGGSGYVTITNGSFWGDFTDVMYWNAGGRIMVSNSLFTSWTTSDSAIVMNAGRLILSGCCFANANGSGTTAINVTSNCGRAVLTGNILTGDTIAIPTGSTYIATGNLP